MDSETAENTISNLDAITIADDCFDTIDLAITKGKIKNEYYSYVGEMIGKNRHGFGYCTYRNGDYYSGQWKNDKMEGLGRLSLKINEIYEGEFKNDIPDGFIRHINVKGTTQGYMKNFKFSNEIIMEKKGKYTIKASVEWTEEKMHSIGVIDDYAGNLYEGEMINFCPCGWGIQVKKGKFIYKGQLDKVFDGYGEVYCSDGSKYFGFFKNNKKHGVVLSFNTKEEKVSIAKYLEDTKNGAILNIHKTGIKVEIWHDGYRVKLIENYDLAKKYIISCYPEYEWLIKLDFMKMISYFDKLKI
jgi:hypothetical protein